MTERRPPAARPASAARRPSKTGAARKAPVTGRRRVPAHEAGRSMLWHWRRGLFLGGLVTTALAGGLASIAFNIALPPAETLLQTSFLCAADITEACGPDNAIATFSAEEDRINVPLEELPPVLTQAVLATEDRDFFEHGGIDPVGIVRALYQDVRGGAARQGGSTITQQYVKNAYLTSERSITRKVKEAVLAVKLERELDKEEILERYLNTIYFGRGAYGVGAASRAYFGKDVRDIGLAEASYLAGLIRSPRGADAQDDPEEATRRRGTVLSAMRQEGYIDAAQVTEVEAMAWDYVIPRRDRREMQIRDDWRGIGAEYFIEAVRIEIAEEYGEDLLYGGGLRIYTTLDRDMQVAAWDAVTSTLDQPDDPEAALIAVDEFGQVKAMIGGRDFQAKQTNYALGRVSGGTGRGPGSSFKPFVLAEALRQGISLNSKFQAPATLTFPGVPGEKVGEDWKVSNYGGTEQGVLDLVDATRVSSNTAYAQLMLEVGPKAVANLAREMGVTAPLAELPSLALGSIEVSPLDMASGFSTFANRGIHNDPTMISKIEQADDDGSGSRVVEQHTPSDDRVLTEEQADQVTYCLRQVVEAGTGRAANFATAVAGKTGTTQNNRDAWFVGFTPRLTAAVWMGYDVEPGEEARFMDSVHGREVTGGSFPAEIWTKFMRAATEGMDLGSFHVPTEFPGRELNPELVLPTSSTSSSSTSTSEATTTTKPKGKPTTTTSTLVPTTDTSTTTSTTEGGGTGGATTGGPFP